MGLTRAARSAGNRPASMPATTSTAGGGQPHRQIDVRVAEVGAGRDHRLGRRHHRHRRAPGPGSPETRVMASASCRIIATIDDGRGAHRLAHADLAGALLHRDQHDVADPHHPRQDGAEADQPDEGADAREQASEALVDLLVVPHAQGLLVVGREALARGQQRRAAPRCARGGLVGGGVADREDEAIDAVADGGLVGGPTRPRSAATARCRAGCRWSAAPTPRSRLRTPRSP